MARPEDSEIERLLRHVVKDAAKREEDVTIKLARSRVEGELGLEDGFLKNDPKWKARSKAIIEDTFQEEEDEAEEVITKTPEKSISKTRTIEKPQSEQITKKATPQRRSEKVHVDSTKAVPAQSQSASASAGNNAARRHEIERDESGESEEDESEESEEDEEDDSDSGNNQTQTLVPTESEKPEQNAPKINGVKRKMDEQSASDETESDSDQEEDTSDQHQGKKARIESSTNAGEDSSIEEDGSGDGSSDGTDDNSPEDGGEESEDEESEAQKRDMEPPEATEEPQETTLQAIPANQFKPPPGYNLVNSEQLRPNSIFSSSSLDGKQIWHITAPSNLPLSSIHEIALNSIPSTQQQASITLNNTTYTATHEDQTESTTNPNLAVLLLTPKGYERTPHTIHGNLHIQQKITLPNLAVRQQQQQQASQQRSTGSAAAADIALPATSSVRPQPKGLRMRYKPPGFGPGKPGTVGSGSDSMEEGDGDGDRVGVGRQQQQQQPSKANFQFPKALGAYGTSVEESAGGAVTNADVEVSSFTPRKAKKAKKRMEKDKQRDGEGMEDGSPAAVVHGGSTASPEDSRDSAASAKKPANASVAPLSNGVSVAVAENSGKEPDDDRAKRKEEKRLKRERKEAKRKAREGVVS